MSLQVNKEPQKSQTAERQSHRDRQRSQEEQSKKGGRAEAAENIGAPGRAPQVNKEPQKPAEESPSQEQKRQATPRKSKAREKRQEDRTPETPGGREAGREEEGIAGVGTDRRVEAVKREETPGGA